MIGSKAKRLRREAEAKSVGTKPVLYRMVEHIGLFVKGSKQQSYIKGYTRVLVPGCTRAIYKDLKRAA